MAPAGREGRWVGAISANACGPNISWPRALGPPHHHHHHLGAARPDQSGPCSGSSVAAQRASWSSPRLLPIPISSFFASCPVLSLRVLGRWLLCSERWRWCHQTNGVLVQKDSRGQVPDGCRVAGGKGERRRRRRRRRGSNRGRRWRKRWW